MYKIRKQNIEIKKQEKTVSYIYDKIMQKTPVDEIKKNISGPISQEIKAILKKLKKIRSINNIKLKPAKTISVVIPHYNHYDYLSQALDSLVNQTENPDEIIIVDDISDNIDRLKKIIKWYKGMLNIQLIIPHKKLYAGGCRQLGAEKSTSHIITMHDADDISHPNRIEFTKYFFRKYKEAFHLNFGLVRFKKNFFNFLKKFNIDELEKNLITTEQITKTMRETFIKQRFSTLNQPEIKLGNYGDPGNYFWGCHSGHVAYRKELVDIIKWTNPSNYVFTKYEDYEFNFLLFLAGQKSFQVDLPLIYYRIGTSTNKVDY